jgi:hypothetical protein
VRRVYIKREDYNLFRRVMGKRSLLGRVEEDGESIFISPYW